MEERETGSPIGSETALLLVTSHALIGELGSACMRQAAVQVPWNLKNAFCPRPGAWLSLDIIVVVELLI